MRTCCIHDILTEIKHTHTNTLLFHPKLFTSDVLLLALLPCKALLDDIIIYR
jgi:hypothetical protein